MAVLATLTSKGQMTLPKEVRDRYGLKPGDKVEFVEENGQTVIKARNQRLIDLVDSLGPPPNGPKTLEEIEDGIASAWAEAGDTGSNRDERD
jgi:antitoxin PrlF